MISTKNGFGRFLGIQGRLGLLVFDFVNGFAIAQKYGGIIPAETVLAL
jgi:hypothetical protein